MNMVILRAPYVTGLADDGSACVALVKEVNVLLPALLGSGAGSEVLTTVYYGLQRRLVWQKFTSVS